MVRLRALPGDAGRGDVADRRQRARKTIHGLHRAARARHRGVELAHGHQDAVAVIHRRDHLRIRRPGGAECREVGGSPAHEFLGDHLSLRGQRRASERPREACRDTAFQHSVLPPHRVPMLALRLHRLRRIKHDPPRFAAAFGQLKQEGCSASGRPSPHRPASGRPGWTGWCNCRANAGSSARRRRCCSDKAVSSAHTPPWLGWRPRRRPVSMTPQH